MHTKKETNITGFWWSIMSLNHWIMKYKSQWPTSITHQIGFTRYKKKSLDHEIKVMLTYISLRSKVELHQLIIWNNYIHPSFSLQDTWQNHWTMKYRSSWLTFIYLFWGQRLGHTVSLSETMTLIHQIVFEMKGKITGPWNIDHCDLHLFLGQRLCHTDSISKSLISAIN